ncbi:MAG: hypothetical protein JXA89_07395 [Anaerolineae bacterium]|nr:hypothetical protein [Anaerolineae bacterium]
MDKPSGTTRNALSGSVPNGKWQASFGKRYSPFMIRYLLVAVLFVAAVSYWAPWVDHDTAALKLSGQDLGEFVKFIPVVRSGEVRVARQLFYLPPFVCALCLVLISVNRSLRYPRWLRVVLLALALLLLPGLLPPVWGHPKDLFVAEFRLQAVALILGLLFILAHGLFRNLSVRHLAIALIGLALVGLLPAQWAFWAFKGHIWTVYGTPTIRLGWGVWLDIGAWVGLGIVVGVFGWANGSEASG